MAIYHRQGYRFACYVTIAILLSGCATQLAPAYDQRIVDGLTKANVDAMTLFASLSNGAKRSQFDQHKNHYDSLIGTLDALEMQIAARPVPPIPPELAAVLGESVEDLSEPPVEPIQGMSRNIHKLRDTHAAANLAATEIEAFRNGWVIYADQALTYEAYLKR